MASGTGPFGAAARAARQLDLVHRCVSGGSVELTGLRQYVGRLKRWLRPFRGVATRYLDHYLAWHRAVETRAGAAAVFALLTAVSASVPG